MGATLVTNAADVAYVSGKFGAIGDGRKISPKRQSPPLAIVDETAAIEEEKLRKRQAGEFLCALLRIYHIFFGIIDHFLNIYGKIKCIEKIIRYTIYQLYFARIPLFLKLIKSLLY